VGERFVGRYWYICVHICPVDVVLFMSEPTQTHTHACLHSCFSPLRRTRRRQSLTPTPPTSSTLVCSSLHISHARRYGPPATQSPRLFDHGASAWLGGWWQPPHDTRSLSPSSVHGRICSVFECTLAFKFSPYHCTPSCARAKHVYTVERCLLPAPSCPLPHAPLPPAHASANTCTNVLHAYTHVFTPMSCTCTHVLHPAPL
jgi:hypothetical protein